MDKISSSVSSIPVILIEAKIHFQFTLSESQHIDLVCNHRVTVPNFSELV